MEIFNSIFIFIFGASIGSFLNVLIDRLPKNESILGRSHCDYCRKKLAWYDLIPVISYFILGGKTRCCYKKLSFQYPLIEIVTGLSFLLITNNQILITKQIPITNYQFSNIWIFDNWSLFVSWFLFLGIFSCLIVIFVSDLKYHLISDYILWALFGFSLLYKVWTPTSVVVTIGVIPSAISVIPAQVGIQSIISALIVGSPIFLIYYISRERAMGLGDVYLTAIIGFLLGWKDGFIALYIAFVTGAIFGIILMIFQKKKLKSKIAFGPFIVIGTIVMLFWGDKIFEMIRQIYGF